MVAGSIEIQLLANMARLQQDMNNAKGVVGAATADMVKKLGDIEGALNKSSSAALGFGKNLLFGAAAGIGFDALVGKITGVIESMAKLKTLSEKTGSSVENLSKLSFIAKSSGSDIDAVTGAMAKLSKGMVGAEEETKGAGAAMKFLGVSAKDAQGNLKDPAVMFTDIAKSLNEYEDGAGKAAIAQALFGKAGADMLPTLKMLAESGDMATKVTTEQAEAARQYTRDMAKLDAQKSAVFKTLATALIPTMSDFVSIMLDASKNTNIANSAAKNLAASHSIEDWADMGAMGVARMIDVLKTIPRAFDAIGLSIAGAMAGLDILATTAVASVQLADPITLARKLASGIDPLAEVKAKVKASESLMSDTKKAWGDLWNGEGDAASKAMQKRIDARKQEHAFVVNANAEELKLMRQNAAEPVKKKANFTTGGGGTDAGAGALSEYDKLINKLEGELAKAFADAEAAAHGYNKSQVEFIALSRSDAWNKLTDDQKRIVAGIFEEKIATEQATDAKSKAQAVLMADAQIRAELRRAEEAGIAAYMLAQQEGYNAAVAGSLAAVATAQAEYDQYGLTKSQIAQITLLTLESTQAKFLDGSEGAKALDKQIAAQKKLIDILKKGELRDDMRQGAIDSANAWRKAGDDIGNTLTKSFGRSGAAMGDMIKTLFNFNAERLTQDTAYNEAHAKLTKDFEQGDIDALNKLQALSEAHDQKRSEDTLTMFGDMAGAASGFFEKQSTGYKILHGIEQAMFIAKLAMQAQTIVGNLLTAKTGVIAGAGQMFGQSGWAAFAGIAAMMAVMASLGFSGGGGGGAGAGGIPVMSAKERQASQGTGSVFGDDSAKSGSIDNSLKRLSSNSDITLTYTNEMLTALNAIRDNILGVVNAIVRSSGLRGGAQDIIGLGIGSSKGAFGFSSSSTELVDQGIAVGVYGTKKVAHTRPGRNNFGEYEPGEVPEETYYTEESSFTPQTIGQVRAAGSLAGSKYSQTHSEESSWWGLSQNSSDNTIFKDLDKSIQRQMGLTVISIANGVEAAANALGMGGEEVRKKIDAYNVDIGLISLKGLSGQALQDELNAVFSKFADGLATSITLEPGTMPLGFTAKSILEPFQKVGEGMFETLVRVASGVEKANTSLDLLGIKAINFTDITNKQGDVPAEIIRQSVVLHETTGGTVANGVNTGGTTTGIGKIIQEFNGSADDMLKLYTTLDGMRKVMVHTGASVADVTMTMVKAAGSIDALKAGIESYYDLFFSEEEKRANTQKDLEDSFAALGVAMPTSIQGFRDLVNAQDLGTVEGQKMYAKLMLLAEGFGTAANAAEALHKKTTDDMQTALAPFRPEESGMELNFGAMAAQMAMTAATGFGSLDEVLALTDEQVAGLTDEQREAITAYANAQNAANQYNEALADAQLTYEEAVMKHNGATDLQIAQLHRTNAAAAVAGLGVHNMAEATDAAYIASLHLTPAQLALVTAYVNSDSAVNSLTASLNESAEAAQEAYQAQQSLASQQIDGDIAAFQTKLHLVDPAIKDAAGSDSGKAFSDMIAYQKTVRDQEIAKAAMILKTSPNGTNYAPYIAAQQNIYEATNSIAKLTSDYLLYLDLEAQYSGKGKSLVDLENWYTEQKGLAHANTSALATIEAAYQKKRADIITGAVTNGLNQTTAAMQKWFDSLRAWLDANLLNESVSPLTAQQRFAAAQEQYIDTLMKAQQGDETARGVITKAADQYQKEALAMYGKASVDYRAIFDATRRQIEALIAGSVTTGGPDPLPKSISFGDQYSAPVPTNVMAGPIEMHTTAKQQTDDLLAEVKAMHAELSALVAEQKKTTRATTEGAAKVSVTVQEETDRTVRRLDDMAAAGARLR